MVAPPPIPTKSQSQIIHLDPKDERVVSQATDLIVEAFRDVPSWASFYSEGDEAARHWSRMIVEPAADLGEFWGCGIPERLTGFISVIPGGTSLPDSPRYEVAYQAFRDALKSRFVPSDNLPPAQYTYKETGYERLTTDSMKITALGTHPSTRGQGLGDLLVRKAIQLAREQGAPGLSVDTSYESNIKFYERYGMRVISKKEYLSDVGEKRVKWVMYGEYR